MTQIEDIIAKAMCASKAWPAVFEAGSAAELATAAIAALAEAGFVVVPRELSEDSMRAAVGKALSVSLSGGYRWPDYMRDLYGVMIGARPK
jgi:hypothetical protein